MPAITLTGPRQSGKTILCQELFPNLPYTTLENPAERALALNDPNKFLGQFPDGAIIDEVQRAPDILSYLQGMIDKDPTPGRWILTGSHNFTLLSTITQSLAGRTAVCTLLPLTYNEIARFPSHPQSLDEVLLAGSYPRIFSNNMNPYHWHGWYVNTYLEKDVRSVSNIVDLDAFQTFMKLCAGRVGQQLNYESLASDCSRTQPTAKAWFTILEASYLTTKLPVFRANIRKRLTKMPKLLFYDSGLACWLLGIRTVEQLQVHPLRGLIFETWCASEIAKHKFNQGERCQMSYYRESNGVEADMLIEDSIDTSIIEFKSSATPSDTMFASATKVSRHLAELPGQRTIHVVYGGDTHHEHTHGEIIPWNQLHEAEFLKPPS